MIGLGFYYFSFSTGLIYLVCIYGWTYLSLSMNSHLSWLACGCQVLFLAFYSVWGVISSLFPDLYRLQASLVFPVSNNHLPKELLRIIGSGTSSDSYVAAARDLNFSPLNYLSVATLFSFNLSFIIPVNYIMLLWTRFLKICSNKIN